MKRELRTAKEVRLAAERRAEDTANTTVFNIIEQLINGGGMWQTGEQIIWPNVPNPYLYSPFGTTPVVRKLVINKLKDLGYNLAKQKWTRKQMNTMLPQVDGKWQESEVTVIRFRVTC